MTVNYLNNSEADFEGFTSAGVIQGKENNNKYLEQQAEYISEE